MRCKYTHEVAQEMFTFDSSPQSKISKDDIPCCEGFGSCYESKMGGREGGESGEEKYKIEQKIDCGGVMV